VLECIATVIRQEKEKKGLQIGKKGGKLSLLTENMTLKTPLEKF
jgi:hypothetical protein